MFEAKYPKGNYARYRKGTMGKVSEKKPYIRVDCIINKNRKDLRFSK